MLYGKAFYYDRYSDNIITGQFAENCPVHKEFFDIL